MNWKPRILVDLALCWIALFGVWPLADPGHGWNAAGIIDQAIHGAAIAVLWSRWDITPRRRIRDRGEVPVWLLLIVLAVILAAGITGHIPLTDLPETTP